MRTRSEKLLVRVDARAAELEDHRMRLGSAHDSSNCFRNIFHIGRLQSGPAPVEHRIDWKLAKELEDGGEKRVVRSEHHSRADEKCIGERGPDRQFAFAALSLAITTTFEHIGHWIKMRQSLAPFSGPESSPQTRSLADFIATTSGFRFSVHTARQSLATPLRMS